MGGVIASGNVVTGDAEAEREPATGISIKQVHVLALQRRIGDPGDLALAPVQILRLPGQGHCTARHKPLMTMKTFLPDEFFPSDRSVCAGHGVFNR